MFVDIINTYSTGVYWLESNDLWHTRLRHVFYKALQKLVTLESLRDFKCFKSKWKIYLESNFVKHANKYVGRNSKKFRLIHTNLCDAKSTSSSVGKK